MVRLRSLVLLPSRDLAMQVHAVFKRYARGTGLRVGLAIGQTDFLEEQLSLVGPVALEGEMVCLSRLTNMTVRFFGSFCFRAPLAGGVVYLCGICCRVSPSPLNRCRRREISLPLGEQKRVQRLTPLHGSVKGDRTSQEFSEPRIYLSARLRARF